jgi:hypothetical protein
MSLCVLEIGITFYSCVSFDTIENRKMQHRRVVKQLNK